MDVPGCKDADSRRSNLKTKIKITNSALDLNNSMWYILSNLPSDVSIISDSCFQNASHASQVNRPIAGFVGSVPANITSPTKFWIVWVGKTHVRGGAGRGGAGRGQGPRVGPRRLRSIFFGQYGPAAAVQLYGPARRRKYGPAAAVQLYGPAAEVRPGTL